MKSIPNFTEHQQTVNQSTTGSAPKKNQPRRLWAGIIKVILPVICFTLMFWSLAVADDDLYSTGRMMEVDRCASAWLIKRHINPQAQFMFFEDGQLITQGISFDTPDSKFCRT
ncbi:MAG: chromate resistance protein, partial [Desulfobacteraceae bacterium]|nr:chromate resistance protein [Desulfobacteraceae bacterium]